MVLLQASRTLAAWVVDDRGDCVRQWTSESLLRGPTAVLNAPLVPFRSAVGGVQMARDDHAPGTERKILLPPLLAVAGGATGLVESGVWLGAGLADTLTGGYFELTSDGAARLSAAPTRPPLATTVASTATTDPCGRSKR